MGTESWRTTRLPPARSAAGRWVKRTTAQRWFAELHSLLGFARLRSKGEGQGLGGKWTAGQFFGKGLSLPCDQSLGWEQKRSGCFGDEVYFRNSLRSVLARSWLLMQGWAGAFEAEVPLEGHGLLAASSSAPGTAAEQPRKGEAISTAELPMSAAHPSRSPGPGQAAPSPGPQPQEGEEEKNHPQNSMEEKTAKVCCVHPCNGHLQPRMSPPPEEPAARPWFLPG